MSYRNRDHQNNPYGGSSDSYEGGRSNGYYYNNSNNGGSNYNNGSRGHLDNYSNPNSHSNDKVSSKNYQNTRETNYKSSSDNVSGTGSASSSLEPDDETLLKYYQLDTLNPTSWNNSTAKEFEYDPADTEDVDKAYEILKSLSDSSTFFVKQIVDEPDPLGYFSSVSRALQEKRIIQSDDDPLKQNYLVGSKSFNPLLFLKHLHDADSFNTLNQSLDFLENSIAEQSQQLRGLIKNEFIRFVKSKSSLDSVFDQIQTSGLLAGGNGIDDHAAKENPLLKLSNNLTMANSKASAIIQPIVDNKRKENNLKSALEMVESNRYLFDLPTTLMKNIENNAYDSLTSNYNKGRDMYFAMMENSISSTSSSLEIATRKLLDRVWEEVQAIVDSYKKDLWEKLADTNSSDNAYVSIISKLLELGVEDNPIVVWINTQFNSLVDGINSNFEKLFENIKATQTHILETINITDITFIYYLQGISKSESSTSTNVDKLNKLSHGLVDCPEIIEMWLIIKKLIDDTIVLSSTKVRQYWNVCELFLNNKIQSTLPKGYKNESAVHLKLASYEKERISKNGEQLIKLVCEGFERFLNTTRDNLSDLSIKTRVNSETQDNYEIKSPQYYGFIPPYANSISTIRYLEKFMTSVFISYNNLGNLNISTKAIETLKASYSRVLKKFIIGICSTWANDVSFFNTLEDYNITNIKKDLVNSNELIVSNVNEAKTNYIKFNDIDSSLTISELILIYQKFVIKNLNDIIFIDNSLGNHNKELIKDHNIKIFTTPNDKFFSSIQNLFLKNLEILLISMMKKVTNENKGETVDSDSEKLMETKTTTLDLYELWTLDNFIELEDRTLGEIIRFYDETFNTRLSKSVGKLDIFASLLPKLQKATFNNYCDLKKQVLSKIIAKGISSTERKSDWNTTVAPKKISNHIYECLTYLVILHSTIAKVSKNLIYTIIHELQNHIATELYDNFKLVPEFSTSGLQQVAIDIQFFKKVFSKNQNFKLGKTSSANLNLIILKVIKTRTDPEMILSSIDTLVENNVQSSKLSFSCFYQSL